jgi:hypothetical protein
MTTQCELTSGRPWRSQCRTAAANGVQHGSRRCTARLSTHRDGGGRATRAPGHLSEKCCCRLLELRTSARTTAACWQRSSTAARSTRENPDKVCTLFQNYIPASDAPGLRRQKFGYAVCGRIRPLHSPNPTLKGTSSRSQTAFMPRVSPSCIDARVSPVGISSGFVPIHASSSIEP